MAPANDNPLDITAIVISLLGCIGVPIGAVTAIYCLFTNGWL